MALSGIMRDFEHEMICDLAEVYHVLDYRSRDPLLIAILVAGLREGSRVVMARSNSKITTEVILMASILDRLSILLWSKTKDAQKGINFPKSVLSAFVGNTEKPNVSFRTAESFEATRRRIISEIEEESHGD